MYIWGTHPAPLKRGMTRQVNVPVGSSGLLVVPQPISSEFCKATNATGNAAAKTCR